MHQYEICPARPESQFLSASSVQLGDLCGPEFMQFMLQLRAAFDRIRHILLNVILVRQCIRQTRQRNRIQVVRRAGAPHHAHLISISHQCADSESCHPIRFRKRSRDKEDRRFPPARRNRLSGEFEIGFIHQHGGIRRRPRHVHQIRNWNKRARRIVRIRHSNQPRTLVDRIQHR